MAREDAYPMPAHAVSLWLMGDQLAIGLPATQRAQGRTVYIPLDKCSVERTNSGMGILARQMGWAALLQLLKDRRAAAQEADAQGHDMNSIGRATSPVQYDIEQVMRALGEQGKRIVRANAKGQQEVSAEDIGI